MKLALTPSTSPHKSRPLRLAIVRQQYRADGGAERSVTNLIATLAKSSCSVSLITREWLDVPEAKAIVCNPPYRTRTSRQRGFARAAQRIFAHQPFDLIQSNERIAGCDVYRAGDGVHREWLRQRGRCQSGIARWLSSQSPYHRYELRAERELFESPRLKAVICNSRMVRDEILNYFAIDPAKLHVIYTGVDTQKFQPTDDVGRRAARQQLGLPIDATILIFVGSGFERKGLALAIKAAAEIPDVQLLVVGKNKRAGKYVKLANHLGCGSRLHLVGIQSVVSPYYAAADALVLPTLYDPFPNVVLEAMACGLPVLTSEKCGGAELVSEAGAGCVVDALDVSGLADAMRHLQSQEVRQTMSAAARRAVESLTLDAMRAKLIRLYRSLLDERVTLAA